MSRYSPECFYCKKDLLPSCSSYTLGQIEKCSNCRKYVRLQHQNSIELEWWENPSADKELWIKSVKEICECLREELPDFRRRPWGPTISYW